MGFLPLSTLVQRRTGQYTLSWVETRSGKLAIRGQTRKSRLLKARESVRLFIRENRNLRLRHLIGKVGQKLRGFYAYFGTPGNARALEMVHRESVVSLMKYLNRRSQRKSYSWDAFKRILETHPVPPPKMRRDVQTQTNFIYALY